MRCPAKTNAMAWIYVFSMVFILDLHKYQYYILHLVPLQGSLLGEIYGLLKWGLKKSNNMSKSDEQNKSFAHIFSKKSPIFKISYHHMFTLHKITFRAKYELILIQGQFWSQNKSWGYLNFDPSSFSFTWWHFIIIYEYAMKIIHIFH